MLLCHPALSLRKVEDVPESSEWRREERYIKGWRESWRGKSLSQREVMMEGRDTEVCFAISCSL